MTYRPLEKSHLFQSGESGNPGGKVGGLFSVYALHAIGTRFLNEYTAEQLLSISKNKKELGKLPVAQALVVQRLAAALSINGGADFDRIFDRLIGKAIQTVNQTNTNVNLTVADMTTGELSQLVREHRGGTIADDSQMVDVTPVIEAAVTVESEAVLIAPQDGQATE